MRGIVQPKPFVKKKIKRVSTGVPSVFSRNRKKSKKSQFSVFSRDPVWVIVVITILILLAAFFLIRASRYSDGSLVSVIHYAPETQQQFNTTELLVRTSKFLRNTHFHPISQNSKLLAYVQKEYPFVSKITVEFVAVNEVEVRFEFTEPVFVVQLGGKKYGVWEKGYTQELFSGSILGGAAFLVDTPDYSSGVKILDGFFYEVPYQRYLSYIPLIKETFPYMNRFVYLVGSNKFVVFENGKMIFFSKDAIEAQFEKLHWLQTYASGYDDYYKIDLASFIDDKIVVQ